MAMILLLDSLSRCLNGTSNRGGGVGASRFPSSDEPAEVQVRLRDRYGRSSKGHDQQRRRRSTTPKNRNGRRRSLDDDEEEEEENHLEELISAAAAVAQQDSAPQDPGDGSTSSSRSPGRPRRRRRQRSAPKLTIEERRNGIFRLPADHPASRPSSPANSAGDGSGSGSANPNQNRSGTSRSRSTPRIHMVTPEPHPVGLMCGRASPSVVFRRGGSGSGSGLAPLSHLLESRALCFASPVRDAQELAEEQAERAAQAGASSAGDFAGAVDNSILLNDQDQVEDDPTVNTADYTYATQDDTVASTHYFEAKLAHLVETSPPMPLYRQYEVTEADPDGAIRQIVETRSHRSSASLGPVQDLAGGLINVVRKTWSAAAPPAQAQSPAPQARSPRGMQEPRPTSPAGQQTATSSSSDPPTPPRYPEQRPRRQRSPPASSTKSTKLGGRHRSDDSNSSVPSLDFSRNSSQST